ncbi:DNA translocase FtsK [Formosa sp. PL04]|uniref:HNH endonuclease n=1 Tax=Formosa sp. PL04 TaxID=3081755 RepID=UPI0039922FD3
MGIFDFIRGNKKAKSENTEKEKIDVSQTFIDKSKKEFLANKIGNVLDENKEITLTEDEIQKYIHQEVNERISSEPKFEFSSSNFDPLFQESAKIIVEHQQGSASLLQRKLKLGYNRAGRLIDELEMAGIVGPFLGQKARTVNLPNINQLELFFQLGKIQNERFDHFKKNILPLHEELISTKVRELIKSQEIEQENELKEILKQEILDKENDKNEKEKRRQLKTQIRKELIEEGILSNLNESDLKREPIPQEVLDRVWNRDGGKCVKCGSQEKIEFDHIIPFSRGGSNTYRNLQILCEQCNRGKSNNIG